MYQIAVNLCLNWRRRETRRGLFHLRWAESNEALESVEPPENHSAADDVKAALMRLHPKQRAAIILTVYDGHNHAEAARILGCSETTVSWRIFSARRKLKRWLSAKEVL